jgi:hypothetical protein
MTVLRVPPTLYTVWLAKLLVGDASCEWATWFRAHNDQFPRRPNTYNDPEAKIKHTSLLVATRRRLISEGHSVTTENQNWFTLPGPSGRELRGKPDLISIKDRGVICDIKTGEQKDFHAAQVLIYMYAVPRSTLRQYKGMQFDGLLVYPDFTVEIPASQLNNVFRDSLRELFSRVSSEETADRIASWGECRWCDILDCHERVNTAPDLDLTTVEGL